MIRSVFRGRHFVFYISESESFCPDHLLIFYDRGRIAGILSCCRRVSSWIRVVRCGQRLVSRLRQGLCRH